MKKKEREERREKACQIRDELKENIKKTKKTKVVISVAKLAILIVIIVVLPIYIFFYHRDFINRFGSFEEIIVFLDVYRGESILIYIAMQVIQIVVCFIPGQAFQFAAGCLFGFPMGLVYSVLGAVIGTALSYYIAKLLGRDATRIFFGEERIQYFLERLNSKKAYAIVFLLYLIPGLPKDVISYAAGVSQMSFRPFLIVSLIGRLPGMAGSLLIGACYYEEHYIAMTVIGILAVVMFFWGIIRRKELSGYIDRFYDKIKD